MRLDALSVVLRFPRDLFDDCIARGTDRLRRGAAAMRLAGGVTHVENRIIVHVRAPEIALPDFHTPVVFLLVCSDEAARVDWLKVWKEKQFEGPAAVLFVGAAESHASGMLSGRFKAACETRDAPLTALDLSGGGMVRVSLRDTPRRPQRPPVRARWARTIEALGSTMLDRIAAGCRIAIIGCSRLGSRIAEDLTFGFGVRSLALIDGDTLESHNLGESSLLFSEEAVGEKKAVALAEALRAVAPWAEPHAIPMMLEPGAAEVLDALQSADLVVSATDTVASRLWAAWTCAAVQVPLLDLAVGALEDPDTDALVVGADVRLLAGGDLPRCLLCLGGIAGAETLEDALNIAASERAQGTQPARDGEHPRTEVGVGRFRRRGSLRHLAELASSLAQQLIIELFTDEEFVSTHVRVRGFDLTRSAADPFASRDAEACLCRYHGAGGKAVDMLKMGYISPN